MPGKTEIDYKQWMKKVDAMMEDTVGLCTSDMPDFRWRDQFEDECSPYEALSDACEYWVEGGDMEQECADMISEAEDDD